MKKIYTQQEQADDIRSAISKVDLEDYRDDKGRVNWKQYKEDSANEEDN